MSKKQYSFYDEKQYEIYGIADEITGRVRYVGVSQDAKYRFKNHISSGRTYTKKVPLTKWLNKILNEGRFPELVILETDVPESVKSKTEQKWIKRFYCDGLLNVSNLGKGQRKEIAKKYPIYGMAEAIRMIQSDLTTYPDWFANPEMSQKKLMEVKELFNLYKEHSQEGENILNNVADKAKEVLRFKEKVNG